MLALWAGTAGAEQGIPAQLSHDEIVDVQTKLRALNFELTVTGVMDEHTRSAIHRLLVENDEGTADFLTDKQVAKLKNTDVSGFKYAAVAVSTDGFHMAVSGKDTRDEAEAEVASACRRRSGQPSKCVIMSRSSAFAEGWVTAIHCTRQKGHTINDHVEASTSQRRERAIDLAFTSAADAGFPRNFCKVLEVVEANGHPARK